MEAGTPSPGSNLDDATALRTSALVDDHTRQTTVNDVHVFVVVEHRDIGDLAGRAARTPCRAGDLVRLLGEVRVRVALVVEEGTFAGAVVGRVALRDDDPVPAELLEVDDKRIAAAAALSAALVAVQVDHTLVARCASVADVDLQIGFLQTD